MNKQQVEDNIMQRVGVLAEKRKANNARENIVMLSYVISLIGVLALMIYLFKNGKVEGLVTIFHIKSIAEPTLTWEPYLPFFIGAAGLSLLAFIGYGIRAITHKPAANIDIANSGV